MLYTLRFLRVLTPEFWRRKRAMDLLCHARYYIHPGYDAVHSDYDAVHILIDAYWRVVEGR